MIRHFGARPFPKPDKQMDAVIISVAHSQFKKMGVEDICRFMNSNPVLIDVRGMVDQKAAEEKGMYYKKL